MHLGCGEDWNKHSRPIQKIKAMNKTIKVQISVQWWFPLQTYLGQVGDDDSRREVDIHFWPFEARQIPISFVRRHVAHKLVHVRLLIVLVDVILVTHFQRSDGHDALGARSLTRGLPGDSDGPRICEGIYSHMANSVASPFSTSFCFCLGRTGTYLFA